MKPEKHFAEIDPNRLDEELVNHPREYSKYARLLADAVFDHDTAKARLEVTEAEVELDVRNNPEKYKIKTTAKGDVREGDIKLRVRLHADVRKCTDELNEAKHKVKIVDGKVNTLEHKKRAMEKVVDLVLGEYHSAPRVTNEGVKKQIADRKQKTVDGRVSKALNGKH